jgi:hypothetical protein
MLKFWKDIPANSHVTCLFTAYKDLSVAGAHMCMSCVGRMADYCRPCSSPLRRAGEAPVQQWLFVFCTKIVRFAVNTRRETRIRE